MELATGPLPPRAPTAAPAEHHADAWGDFLRRVLVQASSAGKARAAMTEPLVGCTLPQLPASPGLRPGPPAA